MPSLIEEKTQILSPDELSEIAGYQGDSSEEDAEAKYFSLLSEQGEVREVHEKGVVRLALIGVIVALVLGCGYAIWQVMSPKTPLKKPVKVDALVPQESEQTEVDRLKAELALRNQAPQSRAEQGNLSLRKSSESLPASRKPIKTGKITSSEPIIRRTPHALHISHTPHTRTLVPPSIHFRQATPFRQVKSPGSNNNPYKQWKQLAELGYSSAGDTELGLVATKSTSKTSFKPSDASTPEKEANSLRGTIGQQPQRFSGEQGILTRTKVEDVDSSDSSVKEVRIGASVKGAISVPLIWSGSESQSPTDGRFAVELTEDLKAVDGSVALKAGTVVVAQATRLSASGMVSSEAIAIISQESGGTQEIPLSSGAISILGAGNSPLLAESNYDPGGDIAQQELLIGTLGALGKVGEIINQPDSSVSVSGYGQSVSTTTNSNRNLTAAALEGFFKPISASVGQRSSTSVKEMLNRKNIAVLRQGKEVSLLVKSILRVESRR